MTELKTYKANPEREILVSKLPGCITVEDYCKWYDLYYICENGTVKGMSEFDTWDDEIDGCDHYYFPESVVSYALKHNMKIDYIAYAAICLRYLEDSGMEHICPEHLPTKEDLLKVLGDFNGSCSCYYLYPAHYKLNDVVSLFSRNEKHKEE